MALNFGKLRSGEARTINFDFADVATGQSYVLLYGMDTSEKYILTNIVNYGNSGATYAGAGTNLKINFDMAIEKGFSVEGKTYISVPIQFTHNSGDTPGVSTWNFFIRNSTATSAINDDTLVSGAIIINHAASITHKFFRKTIDLEVPKTKFKKGETLRITISNSNTPTGFSYGIGHDPANRDETQIENSPTGSSDWANSDLKVLLPIKINQ